MTGLELREIRKKLGLTQEELANEMGFSTRTIINYEKSEYLPKSKSEFFTKFLNQKLEEHNKSENLPNNHTSFSRNSAFLKEDVEALSDVVREQSPEYQDVQVIKPEFVKNNERFENKNGNNFIELPNGQFYMTMPLAEFKIQAGFLDHYQDAEYLMDLQQHGMVVEKPVQGRYIAFRVSGDSMDDGSINAIPRNSIVSSRELQRQHWSSKLRYRDFPYWVIYTKQSKMPLLKEIIDHDVSTGLVTCHSLNDSPEFHDFQIHIDEIQALFYVIDVTKSVSKKLTY